MSSWTAPQRVSSQHPLRNILIASLLLLSRSATCQQEEDTAGSILAGVWAVSDCAVHAAPLLCLRARLLRALDRAMLADRLPLWDGLALVRRADHAVTTGDAEEAAEPEAGVEAEDEAEVDAGVEAGVEGHGLLRRLAALLSTHSLQLSLPGTALLSQGRGKGLKKYGSVLVMGAMMKAAMLAIALKSLTLLAGGALLVAKLAFVLAAVVGLGKLLGGGAGDHEKPTVEYVKHPALAHPVAHEYGHSGAAGGGVMHYEANGAEAGVARWRRSLLDADAHPLAYRARARHLL